MENKILKMVPIPTSVPILAKVSSPTSVPVPTPVTIPTKVPIQSLENNSNIASSAVSNTKTSWADMSEIDIDENTTTIPVLTKSFAEVVSGSPGKNKEGGKQNEMKSNGVDYVVKDKVEVNDVEEEKEDTSTETHDAEISKGDEEPKEEVKEE